MNSVHGKVVLVTGASSGIGKAVAERLAQDGYTVYGTSRKAPVSDKPEHGFKAGGMSGTLEMIQLDVRSEDSAKKAVEYVVEKEGTIDILINNAGVGIAGSVEDTAVEEALWQFETNFFGTHRMCRHVIPVMREKGKGLIINISSVASIFAIPYQAMYSASKRALEAMTEALRMELEPFGIKAALVLPGDTKTGFTGNRQFAEAANDRSAYRDRCRKAVEVMVRDETTGPGPKVVADAVACVITKRNPPVRVVVGFKYKAFAFLQRILPSRLVLYILSKMY